MHSAPPLQEDEAQPPKQTKEHTLQAPVWVLGFEDSAGEKPTACQPGTQPRAPGTTA